MAIVFTHPAPVRFTVEQFQKMGEAGVLPPDARLELIDGEMLEMAPIGARHMQAVNRLTRALVRAVGNSAIVSVQNPIALGEHSEPQPDLVLFRPQADSPTRVPGAGDALLVIEVAESTLQFDRAQKLPLYAKHAIPEVWILNLLDQVLEIHRQPNDGAYRVRLECTARDTVALAALPDVELPVSHILAGSSVG